MDDAGLANPEGNDPFFWSLLFWWSKCYIMVGMGVKLYDFVICMTDISYIFFFFYDTVVGEDTIDTLSSNGILLPAYFEFEYITHSLLDPTYQM